MDDSNWQEVTGVLEDGARRNKWRKRGSTGKSWMISRGGEKLGKDRH